MTVKFYGNGRFPYSNQSYALGNNILIPNFF